jgi:hypothetical protein
MNFLLGLLILLSFQVHALYEDDSRIDLYQTKNKVILKASQAIAYQVDKHELRGWTFRRFWKIVTQPFSELSICTDTKFVDQYYVREGCSGVLIDEDILLTAGNCITEHYCWNDLYYWVFDYELQNKDQLIEKLPKKDFYKCDEVLTRAFDPQSGLSYALLKLKKKVVGRKPISLSDKLLIPSDTELMTLGHPKGLALKLATGARVYDQNETHFLINSDITGESKGSSIINSKTGELEGILIYGSKNYVRQGVCLAPSQMRNHEAQELALKARMIREILKQWN